MTKLTQLSTLLQLAEKKSDEALKRLGLASAALQGEEQKLNMLKGYQTEYDVRFRNSMVKGMAPMMYHNFSSFIAKMQNAVASQATTLTKFQLRVDEARQHWQSCEREKMSYATLLKRAENEDLATANKKEQKETDERATRKYFKQT